MSKITLSILKRFAKLFVAITLILSLSFALMIGLIFSSASIESSVNKFAQDYRYGDIRFFSEVVDKDKQEEISNIPGVKYADARLIFNVDGKLEDGSFVILRAIAYDTRNKSLDYTYQINESSKYPNISVNNNFFKNNHIKVGSLIDLTINEESKTLCLSRGISNPDCVSMILNEYIYGNNPDFGYIFLPMDYLIDTKYENEVNQFIVTLEDYADKDKVIKSVERSLGEDLIETTEYIDSPVSKRIDINITPLKSLSNLVTTLFFCISIGIICLFISQIISQARKDIAIFRTLGYQVLTIRKSFMFIMLGCSVVSIIIGSLLGYELMKMATGLYADALNTPVTVYTYSFGVYVIAIIINILAGQVSTVLGMNGLRRISPNDSLRNDISFDTNNINIYKRFKHLKVRVKYGINNILKNKKRFIFSSLCLSATVFMIFISFAFNDSKNNLKYSLFNKRIKYDYQLFFVDEFNEDIFIELDRNGINTYEKLAYKTISLDDEDINIMFIEDESELVGLYEYVGENINKGIVVEKHLAQKHNLNIGDYLQIEDKNIEIVGMVNEYMNRYFYMSYENIDSFESIDQYSIVCNSDKQQLMKEIGNDLDYIEFVNATSSVIEGVKTELSSYNIGVTIIILCSLIIGYQIIKNNMQANLLEQKKELSVLRTIGYQVNEISRIMFIQTLLQLILSLAIGLLLGSIFAKNALAFISSDVREYPFVYSMNQYVFTIIIVSLFVLWTHRRTIKQIKRWNLVENTKEKD